MISRMKSELWPESGSGRGAFADLSLVGSLLAMLSSMFQSLATEKYGSFESDLFERRRYAGAERAATDYA